ncbi:MAG: STAS domain-containing protein [Coriobacteriia bacterium]|nr:STAS domain-containing protein [Coriobacteriia bacterium]
MSARRAKSQSITVSSAGPVGPDGFASLSAELRKAVASPAPLVIVDLSQAQAIDGACLAFLIATSTQMGEGRTLSIMASPSIQHAFTDWRLDTVLTLAG